jgi:ornithine cyclodeaminase/alanine dehydrogenase-like protein (mu-crystallin family)
LSGLRLFTEDDIKRLLGMDDAILRMRDVFEALRRRDAINQSRRRLMLPSGAVLHQMAGAWGSYFGTKVYSTHPKHGAHFHFMLYDSKTGRPLALFDANHLGQIRTGAASGYAADLLARDDVRSLAIVGSGFQAQTQLDAIARVRRFESIRVWSRNSEKRERFAASRPGVIAVATAEEAVRSADVIVTATSSKEPVIESAWVQPGAMIIAMGSNQPNRCELPADLVKRHGYLVVDSLDQARIEAGDFLLAFSEPDWARVVELKDAERPVPGTTTIFKSLGLGVEDVAAAAHVYESAGNATPVH